MMLRRYSYQVSLKLIGTVELTHNVIAKTRKFKPGKGDNLLKTPLCNLSHAINSPKKTNTHIERGSSKSNNNIYIHRERLTH